MFCPNNKKMHEIGLLQCNCTVTSNFPSLGQNGSDGTDKALNSETITGFNEILNPVQFGSYHHSPRGGYYGNTDVTSVPNKPSLQVMTHDARTQNTNKDRNFPGVEVQYGRYLVTLSDWYRNECVHSPAQNMVYADKMNRLPATPQGKPFTSTSIIMPSS